MPILLSPKQTYKYTLVSDKESENPPVFILKCLSKGAWREIAALSDTFDASANSTESLDVVDKILAVGVIGWENVNENGAPIKFSLDKLDEILTVSESIELMMAIVNQSPTIDDKKKLG